MIKYKHLIISFFFISLIFFGCSLFENEDYYPLKVGNEWKYEGYTLRGNDTTMRTMTEVKITYKINKEDVFVSSSKTQNYIYPAPLDSVMDSSYVYIVETKDAIISYSDKGRDTILSLPLNKDKSWKQVYAGDTITYTVLEQEDVDVPAGTYKKAWKIEKKYKSNGIEFSPYFYYADGVGLIKYHLEYTNADTTYKSWYNLTNVTIK